MVNKSYQITSNDMFDANKILEKIMELTRAPGDYSPIISGDTMITILSEARK